MRCFFFVIIIFTFLTGTAQDSVYVRNSLKFLTSEKCFGRGYVKNGLGLAEEFIVSEIRNAKTTPLFGKSYTQAFFHPVNTFPKRCDVILNGKQLITGVDFIPQPGACGIRGSFTLQKTDSIHYNDAKNKVRVVLKNKLTYSVDDEVKPFCTIEIDKKRMNEEPKNIIVNINNKLNKNFESRNIGCSIKGSSGSDSVIVFSAHYDHLGGIGKSTYFPGANDNASGVSLLLDLIKQYTSNRPKFTTVFIFFAAEEAGLIGSKFLTQSGAMDLKKIKFLVNLDLLGTGDDGIMVVNGAIFEKQFILLNQINTEKKLVKEIRKRGKAANSDHYWFSEAGVPCFFIYTLGGITAYHDVMDQEKTLPLTDYKDVFTLLISFAANL